MAEKKEDKIARIKQEMVPIITERNRISAQMKELKSKYIEKGKQLNELNVELQAAERGE